MWWEGHDPFWKQHVVRTLPPIARLSCKLWRQSHLPWHEACSHSACSHWWYKNMNRRTQVSAIVRISLWRAVSLVVVSEVIRTVGMRSFFRRDTTMGHVAVSRSDTKGMVRFAPIPTTAKSMGLAVPWQHVRCTEIFNSLGWWMHASGLSTVCFLPTFRNNHSEIWPVSWILKLL